MKGSIQKRGENSYRLTVSAGKDNEGKRIRYTKTVIVDGKTEAEKRKSAETQLAIFIAEIERGQFIEGPSLTFFSFCQKWFKEYAEPELAPKTVFRYKEMLNTRMLPVFGEKKIAKITPMNILEFLNSLKEDGVRLDGKKGGLSSQTIKHHYRLLHEIFQAAVDFKILSSNPVANIKAPKVEKKEAEHYEPDEVKQLISALNGQPAKYRCAVLIALAGGLRLGEVMGLTWDNVDFSKNTISIVNARQYLPSEGCFDKDPKNSTSKRTITIPKPVMVSLLELKNQQEIEAIKKGELYHDSGYVFTQWNGSPMHPLTVSKWFPKFLEKNGLRKITFHQLRHTSVSLLINSGMDIETVSRRVGHSTASTTLNIYSHALKSADTESSDRLEKILFNNECVKSQAN